MWAYLVRHRVVLRVEILDLAGIPPCLLKKKQLVHSNFSINVYVTPPPCINGKQNLLINYAP